MAHTYAYCYGDGSIHFGPRVPWSALPIADAPEADLHSAIHGTARLAYDGKTWLVPGVPEAQGQLQAVDALLEYNERVRRRLGDIFEEEDGVEDEAPAIPLSAE